MEQFDATKDDILAVLHPLSSPLSLSLVLDEFSFPYYIMKNLAKSAPPPHSNLSGQHREMFYYCTLTAVFSLFILTIFAHLCLFLIISRHESVLLSYCGYEVSSVVP